MDQNYLRAETLSAANARLIAAQADIGTVRLWGGGLVASVDGLQFVVPVQAINAGPNPKYLGPRRGVTWLNAHDQVTRLGVVLVPGTVRDSLYVLDCLLNLDDGARPELVTSDIASYSDIVFGLFRQLGYQFCPASRAWPTSGCGASTGRPTTAAGPAHLPHVIGVRCRRCRSRARRRGSARRSAPRRL